MRVFRVSFKISSSDFKKKLYIKQLNLWYFCKRCLSMKTAWTLLKISWVESGAEYPFTTSRISLYKYTISFDQPSYEKIQPDYSFWMAKIQKNMEPPEKQ